MEGGLIIKAPKCTGWSVLDSFNLNIIFLSDSLSAAAEGAAGFPDIFCH
jgi:hypothetical protein